jgi:hypothetical protein
MTEYKASRTLVKSAPELWSEVSEASSLKRHLDQFGEIRITRLEPEKAVAWEGESARGTVKLEPSGWGTKVMLTAESEPEEATEPQAVGNAAGPSAIEAEIRELRAVLELGKPTSPRRRFRRDSGLMQGFLRWLRGEPPPAQTPTERSPVAEEQPAVEPHDPLGSAAAPALALNSALDSLGRAHHRPYSRA